MLPENLPKILTYQAKWMPNSEYGKIKSKPIQLPANLSHRILNWSRQLFKRLECRDYARFDWRLGSDGVPRLLEVNPKPGWVWDGHFRKACRYLGWSYNKMLLEIIHAAERRYGLEKHHQNNQIDYLPTV